MRHLLVMVAILWGGWVSSSAAAQTPRALPTLSGLVPSHPRLMLKDMDLGFLKASHDDDPALQKCWKDVQEDADAYLKRPPLVYRKVGPRLLSVSRDCLGRVYALALAYRWTGQEKYAAQAKENLLQVCAFQDWNPSHFLDVAEMSHAVGVGYDWLYGYLDEQTRSTIRQALIEKGLKPGLEVYAKNGWWVTSEYNWNQVCNGGMIIGALAVAETDPDYAERIVPLAVKSLPIALKSYGPDGAWGEGPGYWNYATSYTAYALTALDTALERTFSLLDIDGLSKAGSFPIYTAGPTGLYLNLADVGERSARRPMPCMFWLARTFHNPLYAQSEHEQLAGRAAGAAHLVWYTARPPARAVRNKQLDYYFRGPVEVVTMRSAWDDPNALFLGIKAGYNQVNHGHLDLGSFELDALGVRWARDLGSDNYNLDGYWDSKKGGRRWSYYRLNSASHNVPMLGGRSQDPLAKATFTKVKLDAQDPFAIVDLTTAYGDFAKSALRGVKMLGRRAILLQDEFELKEPCDLVWGLTTDAEITLQKEWIAELTLKGHKLLARVAAPAHTPFTIESAEQSPPQAANKGVKRLVMRLPQAQGKVEVIVLLSPLWPSGGYVSSAGITPLAEW